MRCWPPWGARLTAGGEGRGRETLVASLSEGDAAMATKTPTLLLAEDDPGMLRLVRRSLELAGYRVLVAQDGVTALDLASSEELAMLLLDIGLPGLDGLTVCRRVREFSDVYVIMITAWGAEEDIVR